MCPSEDVPVLRIVMNILTHICPRLFCGSVNFEILSQPFVENALHGIIPFSILNKKAIHIAYWRCVPNTYHWLST